jgi:hypothetical protein
MRTRQRIRHAATMTGPSQPDVTRLVIDLDDDREPIQGRLVEPRHHATAFRGWLALASLIEATRRAQGERSEVVPRDQTSGTLPDAKPSARCQR